MNFDDFGPLCIVISRDEVERDDTSAPISVLKRLIESPEKIRQFKGRVDLSFSGYENTREELFEMPEVRNYVYRLDSEFPFWLFFLSTDFLGLQCITLCFLPPFLTEEARARIHPERLKNLLERRWIPALNQICSASGISESECDQILENALEYIVHGRRTTNSEQDSGGNG